MQHDTLSKTDRVSNRNSSAFFVKLQTSWFRSLNINITNILNDDRLMILIAIIIASFYIEYV